MRGRRVSAAEAQAWGCCARSCRRDELGRRPSRASPTSSHARPPLALAHREARDRHHAGRAALGRAGARGSRLRVAARHARLPPRASSRSWRSGSRGTKTGERRGAARPHRSAHSGRARSPAVCGPARRPRPGVPRAQDALGISHSVAALLGAIPVIGMGVFAPAAAPNSPHRVGAIRAVTVALACRPAAASGARSAGRRRR